MTEWSAWVQPRLKMPKKSNFPGQPGLRKHPCLLVMVSNVVAAKRYYYRVVSVAVLLFTVVLEEQNHME